MHATVSHRGRPRRSPGPAGSSPARPPSRSYLGGDRVPLDIEARHLEAVERHTPNAARPRPPRDRSIAEGTCFRGGQRWGPVLPGLKIEAWVRPRGLSVAPFAA
jgi:hypothetical protein